MNVRQSRVSFYGGETVRKSTVTLSRHLISHNQPMRTEMREQAHTQQANGGGREGGRENQKEAVLTCSHWVRYCHSDKSRYDSPFLLTCGGGRNRAVSPATRGCSSADRQHTAQVCSHSVPGGGGAENGGTSEAFLWPLQKFELLFRADLLER